MEEKHAKSSVDKSVEIEQLNLTICVCTAVANGWDGK